MTNEEAAAMLESMKNYFLPTSPMLEERREITALDLAISALSKQSASSVQADKSLIVDFVAFQKEWLNSHKTLELDAVNNALVNIFLGTTGKVFIDAPNQTAENDEDRIAIDLKKRTITERLIIAESLIDVLLSRNEVIKAVDRHTRDDGTLDDDISCILEEVSPFEQKKSNSFPKEPSEDGESEMNCSDVPDIHVGKTDFQPGDKFILELGEERRMFGEFEIKGTDLYVKTDLIEKLRRFDPDYMGEWIFHADWKRLGYAPYECNWCGRAFDYEMNYCGYCGAYMKWKGEMMNDVIAVLYLILFACGTILIGIGRVVNLLIDIKKILERRNDG